MMLSNKENGSESYSALEIESKCLRMCVYTCVCVRESLVGKMQ